MGGGGLQQMWLSCGLGHPSDVGGTTSSSWLSWKRGASESLEEHRRWCKSAIRPEDEKQVTTKPQHGERGQGCWCPLHCDGRAQETARGGERKRREATRGGGVS